MLKYVILFVIITTVHSNDTRQKLDDHLRALLNHDSTHNLAYHYLWPFSQLMRVSNLEIYEGLELLQIQSDENKYALNLNVKKFKPDELKVKVKNDYIIVEGQHKEMLAEKPILVNHFMQRFALPVGCKSEEVIAVLNEDGVLSISAPKHPLPPPPPERDIPIEVKLPLSETEDFDDSDETTPQPEPKPEPSKDSELTYKDNSTKKEIVVDSKEATQTSDTLLWQNMTEFTTTVAKKGKPLKSTTKVVHRKQNEVSKETGIINDVDYMIEAEMEQ